MNLPLAAEHTRLTAKGKGRECTPALRPALSRPRWRGCRARSTAPAHPRPGAADARERLAHVNQEPRPEQYRLGSKALQESATSFLPDPGRRPDPDMAFSMTLRRFITCWRSAMRLKSWAPIRSTRSPAPRSRHRPCPTGWNRCPGRRDRGGAAIGSMRSPPAPPACTLTPVTLAAEGAGRSCSGGWRQMSIAQAAYGGAPPRARAVAAGRRLQRDAWCPCPVCRSGAVSAGDDGLRSLEDMSTSRTIASAPRPWKAHHDLRSTLEATCAAAHLPVITFLGKR